MTENKLLDASRPGWCHCQKRTELHVTVSDGSVIYRFRTRHQSASRPSRAAMLRKQYTLIQSRAHLTCLSIQDRRADDLTTSRSLEAEECLTNLI